MCSLYYTPGQVMGFSAVITDLLCLRSECKQPSPRATSALTFLHKTQFCMETDASKINVQSLFGFNKFQCR